MQLLPGTVLWLQQLYVRIDTTILRKKQGIKEKTRRGNFWARKARDTATAFFYDKHRRKVKRRERLIERCGTVLSIGTHCLTGLRIFRYKVLQLTSRSAPATCLEYKRYATRVPNHYPNDPQLLSPNGKSGDRKCHSQQSESPTKSYVTLMMFSVKLALRCDIPDPAPYFQPPQLAGCVVPQAAISLGSCKCSGQRELVRIFKSDKSC